MRIPRSPAISAADWDAVVRFMHKNSPSRLAFIRSLPDGPRRAGMTSAAYQDYRAYERAQKSNDPELAQTILARLKLEDDLWTLGAQLRQAPPEQQPVLMAALREKVGQFTDATFQERQERIDRLKRTLDSQQKTLADDTANRQVIVNDRFRDVIRNLHLAVTRPSTQPKASAE